MTDWWKDRAIYQVYPRSFQDSNGNGVGDLSGILQRLDHLADLGIGAVWISPIFRSPMADYGYDIADYRAIDPLFGTMADFDRVLAAAHARGLKLLLDFVPNHTSDQHAWFLESRTSRTNPKRDWYLWHDPAADGGPPNNWMSNFGGSAWELDATTGQYYYHAFLKQQPDLNWRNPHVVEAMSEVMRFWLDKGIDGFRVDVIWHLIKDAQFRDNPPNPDWHPGDADINRYIQVHSTDQPEVHDVIRALRKVTDEYDNRLLIGEIYLPIDKLVTYYGKHHDEVQLPFNFQLIHAPWHADMIGELIGRYEAALPAGGWPNWVLSNHDQPRIAARIGDDQARIAAMLLLTLRGTPTFYYGDELGLGDVVIPPDRVRDPWAQNEPDASFNRDRARTPMQWSDSPFAGFSDEEPWLPLGADWQTRNVEHQARDPGSMLELTRALLTIRTAQAALRRGDYRRIPDAGSGTGPQQSEILAYRRGGDIAVVLNLGKTPQPLALPPELVAGEVLLHAATGARGGAVPDTLAGNDGIIIKTREASA